MSVPTYHIAVILNVAGHNSRSMLRGIGRAGVAYAWVVEPFTCNEASVALALGGRPAGVIADVRGPAIAQRLEDSGLPVVAVGGIVAEPFACVMHDDGAIGRVAAEHFLERGFEHFAIVAPEPDGLTRGRARTFAHTLHEHPHTLATREITATERYIFGSVSGDEQREVLDWLAALPRPVAVFATRDGIGLLILRLCRLANIRVPDELAVLGVHDDPVFCELTHPALSSVRTASERIGYEAAAMLQRMIQAYPATSQPPESRSIPPLGVTTRLSTDIFAVGDPDVLQALRFIQQHAARPLDVGDITRSLPVGRRTLERKFAASLGRTPAQEISRVHLDRVKWMLLDTNLSIAEIADRCGFSHPNRLSNVFRQHMGTTPTAYRKEHRNQP